jgi:hypothetical protein
MPQDYACRIAMPNGDLVANACGFRCFAPGLNRSDALVWLPFQRTDVWHRMHDREFSVMSTTEGERVIKSNPPRVRRIDRGQNTSKWIQVTTPP